MGEHDCDKGPVLDQLVKGQERSEMQGEKVLNAMLALATQQERLIALADKTSTNETSIQRLFSLFREVESDLKDHIIKEHVHGPKPDSYLITGSRNWRTLKASLVGAAVLAIAKAGYDFVMMVLDRLGTTGGLTG